MITWALRGGRCAVSAENVNRAIYRRGRRWWGDFRSYVDVGGTREPLVAEGETFATESKEEAEALYDARVDYYVRERKRRNPIRAGQRVRLRAFAPRFLALKAEQTDVADSTLVRTEQALRTALACLKDEQGRDIDPWLDEFTPAQAGQVMVHLRSYVSSRTRTVLASRSQRYALDVLAELFEWAIFQGHVAKDARNPVRAIPAKPKVRNRSFDHLDTYEAAVFLEALFRRSAALAADGNLQGYEHPLSAPVALSVMLAYSGARPEEGRNVELRDALLGNRRWRLRQHKSPGRTEQEDTRYVPIFPYAHAVLEAYLRVHERPSPRQLLFPTLGRGGTEVPIRDVRKLYASAQDLAIQMLDEAGVEHDLLEKRIVLRSWRPTYCTARAQTTDHGAPIALGTVRQEMGHSSMTMIARVYERLGDVRPRGPHVEYRLPDGRWPGEAILRDILGDERFEELVEGTRPSPDSRPKLRLIK